VRPPLPRHRRRERHRARARGSFPIRLQIRSDRGKERALALGGGGEWFEGWQLAYVTTLAKNGVDLATAEAVVGTSAGSLLGTMLTSGRIAQEANEFAWFAKHPAVMARMVAVNTGAASQTRARELQVRSKSYDPAAIQAMGRAAMAAQNAPVATLQQAIQTIMGPLDWPSPAMHTTANDCYTGERVVFSSDSGVPISHAVSALMSLPVVSGRLGSTIIAAWTAAFPARAPIPIASPAQSACWSDGSPDFAQLSGFHAPIQEELDVVKKSGSEVLVTFANPPKSTNFLDPNEMPMAVKMGLAKAKADLSRVKDFWNG
jgi:NTE family protein